MTPTRTGACAQQHGGDMAKRNEKAAHLVEPTWGKSYAGGPPLTDFTSSSAGPLSPFGEDHSFPLPRDRIRYAHPTDKPNRAGLMADEGDRRALPRCRPTAARPPRFRCWA